MPAAKAIPLEERVAALEAELARLKAMLDRLPSEEQRGWEKIAGAFAGDPAFLEAMRLGKQWRDSHRPKPKKSKARK
jgi:hypothetical protein